MENFSGEANSRHIAVLAFPFGTHAAPLLSLVRRLSAAAPSLVFSFLSTQQSNNSLFRGCGDDDKVKPFNVSEGLPEGFQGNHHQVVDHFARAAAGIFKAAVDAVVAERGKPVDCLITDAFFWFAADFAEELNVPWVALWTTGPRVLIIHSETHAIRRLVGINGPPDKALDFHPEFATLRAADLPEGITSGDLNSGMATMLEKMGQAMQRATAVVANSYDDLDSTIVNLVKSKFNNFLNIGPFALISPPPMDDTHGCLEWLNNHQQPASVVYISFGSVITPPPHELAALAEALEECGLPYLWSFRGDPEQRLPQGFIERTSSKGKIVQWAPQLEVLRHSSVGAFVTHGGWNSVLESIIGGVPMICRPLFGDQRLNTASVECIWGFGLGLEGGTFTKQGTTKALKRIMMSEEGKVMREKLQFQKLLAFKAVQPDGSSVENFRQLVKIVS